MLFQLSLLLYAILLLHLVELSLQLGDLFVSLQQLLIFELELFLEESSCSCSCCSAIRCSELWGSSTGLSRALAFNSDSDILLPSPELLVGVKPLALFLESILDTLLGGVSDGVFGSLDLCL